MQHFVRTIFLLSLLIGLRAEGQLKADFGVSSSSSTSGCAPLLVQFQDKSTGSPTSYYWDLGNGATSAFQNPSTSYDSAGTYTVKLTVSDGTTTNTKTITNYITVYPAPKVDFKANDTAGCPGFAVTFTDHSTLNASGTGKYLWNFGDGTADSAKNPTKNFYSPGYYSIALRVTNSQGCEASATKTNYIHVFTPPSIDFSASDNYFCSVPASVTFSNNTTGKGPLSYEWKFGDGGTSPLDSPTHSYTTTGYFDVTLIATDGNGCKDTFTQSRFIKTEKLNASFTISSNKCVFDSATFTNTTTTTLLSSTWLYGDGSSSGSRVGNANGSHYYTTAGTYTVSLIAYDGYCRDTTTGKITVYPSPNPVISFTPAQPCPTPSTVTFKDTTGTAGTTYSWTFSDGGSSTLATSPHTFMKDGVTDTINLVVTDAHGCKAATSTQLEIFPLYVHIIGANKGCIPMTATYFDSLSMVPIGLLPVYPGRTVSHKWNFGDGTASSTAAKPTHTYTKYGTYVLTDTAVTSNGCTVSTTDTIRVGTPPIPDFSGPSTICINHEIDFTNHSTGATNYVWEYGDGSTDTTKNGSYKFQDTASRDTVTLVAYNNGCPDSVKQFLYVRPPKAGFQIKYHCDSLPTVTFLNTSLLPTSVKWYFGDGDSSSVDSPSHTYRALGTFVVTLIAYNDTAMCSDTMKLHVMRLAEPQPLFTASDTAICKDQIVTFTSTIINGPAYSYAWSQNGVPLPIWDQGLPVVKDTFTTPGHYDIELTISDFYNCFDSLVKYNYIAVAKPVDTFAGTPISGCEPLSVNLTDYSTDISGVSITNRLWSFGDGTSASVGTASKSHLYTIPDSAMTVTLIVTDNIGCKDTLTQSGYIIAYKPSATLSTSTNTPCIGIPDLFYYTSTSKDPITNVIWDFGDSSTSTDLSPDHTYKKTGTYTVTLIVFDGHGCSDTIVQPKFILVTKPTASFNMDDSVRICPPLFVNFTNTSTSAVSYYWDFGDTASSTIPSPNNLYTYSGYYTVKLVAFNSYGCTDTAISHVNIFGYAGALTYSPLKGCAPLTVNFVSSIKGASEAVWDFSDGVTSSDTSDTTTHTYYTPGAYVPKLLLGDGKGCESSSSGLDTIKIDGIIPGYKVYPACEMDTVRFYDTSKTYFSSIVSREWIFDGYITDYDSMATMYYDTAGKYPVSLIVKSQTGCIDTLSDSVTIYPPPNIDAGADTTVCVGDAATLMPSGGVSYTWSPAATLSCSNCTNPLAKPTVPTTYTVVGTDIHGCVNSDTVSVGLKTVATGIVDSGGTICQGDTVQLHASGAQHYLWIPSTSLSNSSISDPFAFPQATTTYMMIASEGSCIPDTAYATVNVHPAPQINAGGDQQIVAGQSVTLLITGTNVTTYSWTPDTALSCDNCPNPVANPLITTTYTVRGYSDFGCYDSAKVTVHVVCDKSQVFIPNSFTPNGDGMNDIFYPRGAGIKTVKSFQIYNRWGEMLFEKDNFNINDALSGWNGRYKGAEPKPDVYVYIIVAECESGEEITWKGDVTIIR